MEIIRRASPNGYNLDSGILVELNIGIAEAIVTGGEVQGFNIINKGKGLPSNDALLVEGEKNGE